MQGVREAHEESKPYLSTIQEALGRLGSTAEEARERLAKLGCRGGRRFSGGCPLARYLQRHYGLCYINVGQDYVSCWDTICELPEHLVEFIKNFDKGSYPELIRSSDLHPE